MLSRAQVFFRATRTISLSNHTISVRPFFSTIAGYFKSRDQIKKGDDKFQRDSPEAAFVNIDINTYGKDVQDRIKRRLNWNVNRYEQR